MVQNTVQHFFGLLSSKLSPLRPGKIYLYAPNYTCPIGHAKKKGSTKIKSLCARPNEKQLETAISVLFQLNRASSCHFYCNSISKVFPMRLLQCEFFSMSKIRCVSKILMLPAHPSKSVQKNMLKAWDFNKYKLFHISFGNNLQKNCRTSLLQSDTAQILLIVVLLVGLFLDN